MEGWPGDYAVTWYRSLFIMDNGDYLETNEVIGYNSGA